MSTAPLYVETSINHTVDEVWASASLRVLTSASSGPLT